MQARNRDVYAGGRGGVWLGIGLAVGVDVGGSKVAAVTTFGDGVSVGSGV